MIIKCLIKCASKKKNSDFPSDNVRLVIFFISADHNSGFIQRLAECKMHPHYRL